MTRRGGSPLGDLAPLGGRRFARLGNVIVLGSAPSTNDVARDIAEKMLAEETEIGPTAVVALRQTAGKGRAGRSWTSGESGSLTLSVILPWPEGPGRIRVPVEAGIWMARGLTARFGVETRLKWPNDLLSGGRKLGGILVEGCAGEDGEGYAVVGIGLNLTTTREELDARGLRGATSLALEGAPPERLAPEPALIEVLRLLDEAVDEEIADLPAAFLEVSAHALGERLVLRDGERSVEGAFRGLTADGLLRLETAAGTVALLSGDVSGSSDPAGPSGSSGSSGPPAAPR